MTHEEKVLLFEENYEIFNAEIEKRRRKWTLKANLSLDFCDVKQICLRHLFVKLDLYDKNKSPISHWCNAVISSQIFNILRNNYFNVVKPCQRCSCAQGDEGCELYDTQSAICPLYKKWEQTKKSAYDIRLALPSENHANEIFNMPSENYDYQKAALRLHSEMSKILKKHEWIVYEMMFILHMTDAQIAKKMRWVSSEPHRKAGYGNLIRLKKIFLQKAHKIKEEIDLF